MNSRQTLMPANLSERAKSRKAVHEEGSLFDFKRRSHNQTLWYLWFSPFQMVCSSQHSPPFTADSELPFKLNLNSYKKTLTLLVSRKHYWKTLFVLGCLELEKDSSFWLLVWEGQSRKADSLHLDHATILIQLPHLCQDLLPFTAFETMICTKKQLFYAVGLFFHLAFIFMGGGTRNNQKVNQKYPDTPGLWIYQQHCLQGWVWGDLGLFLAFSTFSFSFKTVATHWQKVRKQNLSPKPH